MLAHAKLEPKFLSEYQSRDSQGGKPQQHAPPRECGEDWRDIESVALAWLCLFERAHTVETFEQIVRGLPASVQEHGGDGRSDEFDSVPIHELRRLTFDLSGVPKARPLEGRVRRLSHCEAAR